MSKLFVCIVVGICVTSNFVSLKAQTHKSNQSYDFRKTQWGMSRALVETLEDAELIKSEKSLLHYKTFLFDYDVLLSYYFINDQLVHASYIFEYSNGYDDCIALYNEVKRKLDSKYGISLDDKLRAMVDSIKANTQDSSVAERMRIWDVYINTNLEPEFKDSDEWTTDKTKIKLILHEGKSSDYTVGIKYWSKKHESVIKNVIENQY